MKKQSDISVLHCGRAFQFKYSIRLYEPNKHAPSGYFHNMTRVVLADTEKEAISNLSDYTDVFDKGIPEIKSIKYLGYPIAKTWDRDYWVKIMA